MAVTINVRNVNSNTVFERTMLYYRIMTVLVTRAAVDRIMRCRNTYNYIFFSIT